MISLNATIVLASAFFTLAFAVQHFFTYLYGKRYYKKELKYLYAGGLFLSCFIYLLGQAYLENSRESAGWIIVFWHRFQHVGLFGVMLFLPLLIFNYTETRFLGLVKWGSALVASFMIVLMFATDLFIENTVYLLNNYVPHGKEGPFYIVFQLWIMLCVGVCIYQLIRKLSKNGSSQPTISILLTGMGIATVTAIYDMLGTITPVKFLRDVSVFSYGVTALCVCFAYEASSSSIKTSGKLAQANHTIQEQEKALMDAARMNMAGRLASGVVHDMRNVLSIISLANTNLEMLTSDEEMQKVIDQQRISIDMGSFFMENLYGFAKEGRLVYEKNSKFSPFRIMSDLDKMLQAKFKKKDVCLSYEVPPTLVLRGTRSYFMQVCLNILFNAFEAVPSQGEICVTVERDGENARFFIKDNGPGIPLEIRENVFEFMYSTKKSGSGIGLFVTKNIVEKSKGTINILDSASGCLFEICWPCE